MRNLFTILMGLLLASASVFAQAPAPKNKTPGEFLLQNDPQDPYLRYRYFPQLFLQAIQTDSRMSERLSRTFLEQVKPYFEKDPSRLETVKGQLTFWSESFYQAIFLNETFDPKRIGMNLETPGALTPAERAVLHWAFMRAGLDELSLSSNLSYRSWNTQFFGTLERHYVDARQLLQIDPRFALGSSKYLEEFYATCISEYQSGNRSRKFLRLGEIFSRFRNQAFAGMPEGYSWSDFEKQLDLVTFDQLSIDELSFLLVLRRMEIDIRFGEGIPWGLEYRERVQSLVQGDKVWGVLDPNDPKNPDDAIVLNSAYQWTKPALKHEYEERLKSEQLRNLSPDRWIEQAPWMAVALGAGVASRIPTKFLRMFKSFKGPVPFDLLDDQMSLNPKGSVAANEAEQVRAKQMRDLQDAKKYAQKKFGKGEAIEDYLMSRAKESRDRRVSRSAVCADALSSGGRLLSLRRRALRQLEARGDLQSETSQSPRDFIHTHFEGAQLPLKFTHPKYWGLKRRLSRFGQSPGGWRISSPKVLPGERFVSMIPGESLRLGMLEGMLVKTSSLLTYGGALTLGGVGVKNTFDYLWGRTEVVEDENGVVQADPLWNQLLSERVSEPDLKDLLLEKLISELKVVQANWNPVDLNERASLQKVQMNMIAHPYSSSSVSFETGKPNYFFVLVYQGLERMDAVTEFANRLNGYMIRFESVTTEPNALDLRTAGKVGWKVRDMIFLGDSSYSTRQNAALTIRTDGEDLWIDPVSAQKLFESVIPGQSKNR